MKGIKLLNILTVMVVLVLFAPSIMAQAARTWVSGVGDDANPCSRTAPCKTFAGAISKTALGGEISVLDPGGFGAVTITKAITIDGGTGAGWASILAGGSNGIVISASPNDVITLRNLSINGIRQTASAGLTGIRFLAGKALHVDNVNIFGFSNHGIEVSLNAAANVTVQDTTIREIGQNAIVLSSSSGAVVATLDGLRIDRVNTALSANTGVTASIRNSAISTTTAGISTSVNAQVTAENCMFLSNAIAVSVGAGTTGRLTNNLIVANSTGVSNIGTVQTSTDNKFLGNGTNVTGNALQGVVKQ
jgi:hypothetical protein